MIKLADILEEGIFDFLKGKQEPQKQTTRPVAKKSQAEELVVDEVPVTAEGISNDGKGYTVWAGNNPIGDMRQDLASKGGSGYGEVDNKVYYYVSGLKDHVHRNAYFTVSTPSNNPKAKEVIKKVADNIIKTGKQNSGINTYSLKFK